MATEIIGRGWVFPPQVGSRGGLSLTSERSDEVAARRLDRARRRIRATVDRRRAERWWTSRGAALDAAAAEVVGGARTVSEAAARLEGEAHP